METWLLEIFDWLPSGGTYYALIGAISFIESLAVIGIFCPGSVLIVFAGFLAANGKGSYTLLVTVSAVGALAGDLLSYLLGARFGSVFMHLRLMHKRKALLRKSQIFFLEHGGKSVFFGRFVGFLRPFIPFVAGTAQMRPGAFFLYALVSGILWGLAYPGLGYFFGASWKLVQLWTGRFSLLLTILLIVLVINGLFWKKFVPRLVPWVSRHWQQVRLAWQAFLQSPAVLGFANRYPRLWIFLLGRFSLQHGSGLYLTIGFSVCLLFALLFLWLAADIPFLGRIDGRLYGMLAETHHPTVTTLMLVVTSLANGPAIAVFAGLVLLWLILDNRDFSALLLLVGLGGGELLVYLLKFLIDRPRPVPFLPGLQTRSASLPSGHAFTALLFCGLVVYFSLGTVSNWQSRLVLLLSGSLLASLVGFSRIYLGVHWLSDVLSGFALAAVWLTFLITASELRRRYGGEFPWHTGWHPIRFSRPVRLVTIFLAGLGVLAWTINYVRSVLVGL
ncbi:MAG TPA: bifunctional DedA family/phosphatase PAP2 family protein [Desulfuromonadales bacterium]